MRLGQIRSLVKPQFVLPFHPRLTLVRGATAELPQQIEQGIAGAGNGPIDGDAGLIGDDETLILRADDLHAALHAILTEHRNEVVDDLKRLDDRSAHAGRQVSVFGARRTELDERLAANDRETAMLNAKRTQRQEIALDVTEARSILAALASARSEAQTVPLAALALAQAWSDFEARREGALTAASSLHVDGPHELSPFDPEVAKEVHRLHGEVEDAKEAAAGNRARRGKRQLAEAERLLNEYLDRFGFRSYLTYVLAISTDDEGSAQSRELARSLRDQRAADAERRRVEQLESLALDFERQRRHLRDETLALMGSEPEGDPIEALRAYREPSPKIAGLHVQLVTFLRLRGIDVDMERGDDPDALAASWLARQAALLTSGHPDAAAELERDLADAARARSAISAEHLETRTALDRANAESERLRVDALALRTELAKIERREAEAAASGGAASTTPADLVGPRVRCERAAQHFIEFGRRG
jgi:hypothetical protein